MYVSKSEHVSGNIVLESYCKPTMMVEGFVNKNVFRKEAIGLVNSCRILKMLKILRVFKSSGKKLDRKYTVVVFL